MHTSKCDESIRLSIVTEMPEPTSAASVPKANASDEDIYNEDVYEMNFEEDVEDAHGSYLCAE